MELRFGFGANWRNFLKVLNEERIVESEKALKKYLNRPDLKGLTFIDVGSGSELMSLAARRLGAQVCSFDYDANSVACTQSLKDRYFKNDDSWKVMQGSALDEKFLTELGTFDIAYSWGVLHHTGSMWKALDNFHRMVRPGGQLFVSIYNDQGNASKRWTWLKQKYNQGGQPTKSLLIAWTLIRQWSLTFIKDFIRHGTPLKTWNSYSEKRGMSAWYDLIDWIGGYPFEVASPEEIFRFYRDRNFELQELKTCGSGLGCNEFVFKKK